MIPTTLTHRVFSPYFDWRTFIALLSATFLLSACSSTPKKTPKEEFDSAAWQSHQHEISQIHSWYAGSKIAVLTPDQGFGGHLSWQQDHQRYELDFVGPMGVGFMQVHGDATQTSLIIPDKPAYTGNSPEQLLRIHTGYQLPVSQFYFWARGIPNPTLPHNKKTNPSGTLKQLQQLGWNIEYSKYQRYQALQLPSKIVMTKDTIKVKLVRLNWQAIRTESESTSP